MDTPTLVQSDVIQCNFSHIRLSQNKKIKEGPGDEANFWPHQKGRRSFQ